MARSYHIPSELVKTILDGLDGDILSLRQCSLVDHIFLSHSQKLLFKRVSLGGPSNKEMAISTSPARKFYDHIIVFPHLRRLVLELAISDYSDVESELDISDYLDTAVDEDSDNMSQNSDDRYSISISEAEYRRRDDRSWFRTDKKVAKILPLLIGLKELYVGKSVLWFNDWSPKLQSAILAVVPSLAGLSLHALSEIPLQILKNVPKLKKLTLVDHVTFVERPGLPAPSTSRNTAFETFHVTLSGGYDWRTFHPWIQTADCALDMTHVSTLHIQLGTLGEWGPSDTFNSREVKAVTWLLNSCANALRKLHISFLPKVTHTCDNNDSFIDLGYLQNLQQLSLEGRLYDWKTSDGVFTWLVKVLKRIPPNGSMNDVHLSLTIIEWEEFSQADFTEAPWDDLVQVLLQLKEFAAVSIMFWLCEVRGPYIKDILKERLAVLFERGMVTLGTGHSGEAPGELICELGPKSVLTNYNIVISFTDAFKRIFKPILD